MENIKNKYLNICSDKYGILAVLFTKFRNSKHKK